MTAPRNPVAASGMGVHTARTRRHAPTTFHCGRAEAGWTEIGGGGEALGVSASCGEGLGIDSLLKGQTHLA